MTHVEIQAVSMVYHTADGTETAALTHVSFGIQRGEFLAIVGPSGCGKSTLLMCVDGLIQPTAGRIVVAGKQVSGPGPDRAVVFQEFALFPWRTVLQNVCFGMELRDVPAAERLRLAAHYVDLVGLGGFARHYPHQLSGGMRQRVAIARALAVNPDLLLMDEPFGALDAQTREVMGNELMRILARDNKTVLFVTHSIEEAVYLADRVVIMTARPGRVKSIRTIDLPRPRDPRVRLQPRFIEYRESIWDELSGEVQKSMAVAGGDRA